MRILKSESFIATPWKNGGGVTREILKQDGATGFDWRLSIATVDQSGPFSRFDGYHRILTVLSGKGMWLKSPGQDRQAAPLQPVHFDGAEDIDGVLIDGPCRDFNVIYRPDVYAAKVDVVTGPCEVQGHHTTVLLLLTGTADEDLGPGDVAVLDDQSLTIGDGDQAIVVTLRRL